MSKRQVWEVVDDRGIIIAYCKRKEDADQIAGERYSVRLSSNATLAPGARVAWVKPERPMKAAKLALPTGHHYLRLVPGVRTLHVASRSGPLCGHGSMTSLVVAPALVREPSAGDTVCARCLRVLRARA